MRSTCIKMMVGAALIAVGPTLRAETRAAEHAWVLSLNGNYYGLVQWDHSEGTDSASKRKRTVIYFGAYEHTVYQPAVLVAGVVLFGLSSFVLIPFSIGSRMRNRKSNETAAWAAAVNAPIASWFLLGRLWRRVTEQRRCIMPTITRSSFVIAVPDLQSSAAFYRDVLGFAIRTISDPGWLFFICGDCTIMAGECPAAMHPSKLGDHSYFAYLHIADIDSYYQSVTAAGARISKPLRDEPWGQREFGVVTADGHRIMFGSPISSDTSRAPRS